MKKKHSKLSNKRSFGLGMIIAGGVVLLGLGAVMAVNTGAFREYFGGGNGAEFKNTTLKQSEWTIIVEEVYNLGKRVAAISGEPLSTEESANSFWEPLVDKVSGLDGADKASVVKFLESQSTEFENGGNLRVIPENVAFTAKGLTFDNTKSFDTDIKEYLYVDSTGAGVNQAFVSQALLGLRQIAEQGLGYMLAKNNLTAYGLKAVSSVPASTTVNQNRMEWAKAIFGENLGEVTTATVSQAQVFDAVIDAAEKAFALDLTNQQVYNNIVNRYKSIYPDLTGTRPKSTDADW